MLRRADRAIWWLVDLCLLMTITTMVAAICFQVLSRITEHSAPWTEELSRFLFIWTAFLGMATGFRSGDHPRVDLVVRMLPLRIARWLRFLTPLCALVFFGIAGWFAYTLIVQQLKFGETSPAMDIGMWIITLPVLLGSALAIIGAFTAAMMPSYEEETDNQTDTGKSSP